MEMIRFCPWCGHVGPIPPPPALNCCPDGHRAQMVPVVIALIAGLVFELKLRKGRADDPNEPYPAWHDDF